jgi:tRNA pseudouridine38-40 synthase
VTRRAKAIVQYDGTDFVGFQRQKNGRTVQAVLEQALSSLFGHTVTVKGAGRTDSGVHARGQVISFLYEGGMPGSRISRAVQGFLPDDVAISESFEVPLEFDTQKDAVSKTYCYRIWRGERPDILIGRYAHRFAGPLDLDLMRRESASLLGKHDFASFRASGSSAKTTVREVKDASWSSKMMAGGELLEFWIAADGFLYKMVRLIVGTLLDIGRGHLKEGTVARVLGSPEPGGAGQCVPGKGLCLEKVSFS